MRKRKADSNAKSMLVDKVRAILYLESAKPCEEMNAELVADCSDFLMEAESRRRLKQSEIQTAVTDVFGKLLMPVKRRISAKALITAAIIAIMLFASLLATQVTSHDPLLEFMNIAQSKMKGLDYGESTFYEGEEVFNNPPNGLVRYDTVEEFLAANDGDFLYPSQLPSSIWIRRVDFVHTYNKEGTAITPYKEVRYVTNNVDAVSIFGTNDPALADEIEKFKDTLICEVINGYECYYSEADNGDAQGYIKYGDYIYTINVKSKEYLYEIIKGLKER